MWRAPRGRGEMSKTDSVVCRAILLALLTAAIGSPIVSAQQVYGSIYGTVVDPTGSAVPKVKVTITDQAKATKFEVVTNEAGNYSKDRLIPGTYPVQAEGISRSFE